MTAPSHWITTYDACRTRSGGGGFSQTSTPQLRRMMLHATTIPLRAARDVLRSCEVVYVRFSRSDALLHPTPDTASASLNLFQPPACDDGLPPTYAASIASPPTVSISSTIPPCRPPCAPDDYEHHHPHPQRRRWTVDTSRRRCLYPLLAHHELQGHSYRHRCDTCAREHPQCPRHPIRSCLFSDNDGDHLSGARSFMFSADTNKAIRLLRGGPDCHSAPTLEHVHVTFVPLLGCIGILFGIVVARL
jgi:hypothetical protein